MKNGKGFTLTELIILIIVTGIAFGFLFNLKDAKQTLETKSIISQIEQYNSAVQLFKEKYGELPGDISRTKILGLSEHETDGNENEVLEDDKSSIYKASGEIINFWYHLSNSGFLLQKFDGKNNEEALIGSTFPALSFNENIGITVFGFNENNYYQIGVSLATKNNIIMSDKALKTQTMFRVDRKIDDGIPRTGSITAVNGDLVNGYKELNKNCVTQDYYNLRYKESSCQMRIKFPKRDDS